MKNKYIIIILTFLTVSCSSPLDRQFNKNNITQDFKEFKENDAVDSTELILIAKYLHDKILYGDIEQFNKQEITYKEILNLAKKNKIVKDSAIALVKTNQYTSSILWSKNQSSKSELSNLEFANRIAESDPNRKYFWEARNTGKKHIYIVAFVDEEGSGYRWEANLKEEIVKYVNANEYLSRKYGLSKKTNPGEFTLENIVLDTLIIEKEYNIFSEKYDFGIKYDLMGEIKNNTDKSLTDADLEGKIMLIFKEKTIGEKTERYTGLSKKVSKSSPWKPGETIKFRLKSKPLEIIYLDYTPEYLIFEVKLYAEDPIGYEFKANVEEINLLDKWKIMQKMSNDTIE